MIPPIQQVLLAAPAVTAIVGDRISRQSAPEGQARPYIVWGFVSNIPGITLSCRPSYDDQRIRINVWSPQQQEARVLAFAARDALEQTMDVVFGPVEHDDLGETKMYGWVLDVACITGR